MHTKYEVFTFHGSKVMAKVKVWRQTNKQTDRQTGQKQYTPRIYRSGRIKIALNDIHSELTNMSILGRYTLQAYN